MSRRFNTLQELKSNRFLTFIKMTLTEYLKLTGNQKMPLGPDIRVYGHMETDWDVFVSRTLYIYIGVQENHERKFLFWNWTTAKEKKIFKYVGTEEICNSCESHWIDESYAETLVRVPELMEEKMAYTRKRLYAPIT